MSDADVPLGTGTRPKVYVAPEGQPAAASTAPVSYWRKRAMEAAEAEEQEVTPALYIQPGQCDVMQAGEALDELSNLASNRLLAAAMPSPCDLAS